MWKRVTEPWYGAQCVGWCKVAWKELYGINLWSFWWSALSWWSNSTGTFNDYKKVINTIDALPQKWDMVFFNNMFWSYWHVAIVVEATINQITVIEQNWGMWSWTWEGSDAIRLYNYSYDNVLGWYKFENDISIIEKKLASEVKNYNSMLRDETQDVDLRNMLNKTNTYLRSKYGF